MIRLHHVAICVTEFARYVDLFERLGMQVQKSRGEAPCRQLWFEEGIQLNEVAEDSAEVPGGNVDHIALGVSSMEETKRLALSLGCTPLPKGDKWFALPNGVAVELMEE